MNASPAGSSGAAPGAAPGYSTPARVFHWAIAGAVLIQIPAGVLMTSEPLVAIRDPLYVLHKGLGVILLVLVALRVLWRLTHRPPPFPDYVPRLEQRIAGATHVAIYVALVVQVVSGYVRTVGDNFPIELLDVLGIPPLIPPMPRLAQAMLVVHQISVLVLLGLVAVHVSAVLRYQLIERRNILARMWPLSPK